MAAMSTCPLSTEMLKAVLCICVLSVFTACTRQEQNQHPEEVTQPQLEFPLPARVTSLEHDVRRLKNDVVRLDSQHYIDGEIQFVLDPSSRDCEFVVSEWPQTQETLNGFINDSTAIRHGFGQDGPDPRIQSGIKRLLAVINRTCKSNLIFNAKPR